MAGWDTPILSSAGSQATANAAEVMKDKDSAGLCSALSTALTRDSSLQFISKVLFASSKVLQQAFPTGEPQTPPEDSGLLV